MYRALIRPLLYLLPAETAHHFAFACLRLLAAIPGVLSLLRRAFHSGDEAFRVRALGIDFPNPIGLAAGFDKDAVGYEALGAMGFGFIEVGTLTGQPQPGNPRPRLFRLPKDSALVNRMGFNNHGSAAAVARLQRPRQTIVGVNIGKTKVVPEEDAIGDYVASAKRVVIIMTHCNKKGEPKLLKKCGLPLTGVRCVHRVITEHAVFDFQNGKMILQEIAPNMTVDKVRELTQADFVEAPRVTGMYPEQG